MPGPIKCGVLRTQRAAHHSDRRSSMSEMGRGSRTHRQDRSCGAVQEMRVGPSWRAQPSVRAAEMSIERPGPIHEGTPGPERVLVAKVPNASIAPIRMFLHRSTVPPYSGPDFAGLVRSAWANSGTGGYDGRRRIRPAAAHLIFGAAPATVREEVGPQLADGPALPQLLPLLNSDRQRSDRRRRSAPELQR
jgi:hypothetical protein